MVSDIREALGNLHVATQVAVLDRLGAAFQGRGYELSLVGGPVRDAFLGREISDFDLTTDARPDQTMAILAPMASAHWDVGREYGTIGARIDGVQVEVTTYRSDRYDHRSRKPEVDFGDTLEADLRRRDFTVNAMALRLPSRTLVDPFNGLSDLMAGVLRTPAPAVESFADDPLRMMRAARFVSQLGFTVEPSALKAIVELTSTLTLVSAERIQAEFTKLMLGGDPESGIEVLVDTGLADEFLPEVPGLRLEVDEHHHHKDVYRHTLTVLRQAIDQEEDGPDLVLRLAALLHDIGKPKTRRLEPGGKVTFYQHDLVGARMARKRLTALRFDKDTTSAVCRLIELHLRFFGYAEGAWTDSAVRRYVRDAGDLLPRLHKLVRADVTTRNAAKARRLRQAYDDIERRIDELAAQEELDAIRPDLDGTQIMAELGVSPGPVVGKAYAFLLEQRLDEGPLGESEARRRLRSWAQQNIPGWGDASAGQSDR